MRVRVGFTPGEPIAAHVAVVVDVLRATSTITQALFAHVRRVTCVAEIEDARALAGPGVALAGERDNVRIEGFDYGNSPREFLMVAEGINELVTTTTNGTRLLLAASSRCDTVLVASLLNLGAVIDELRGASEVAVLCAGVEGGFALDDAYVAGRIVAALGGERDDAANAAARIARGFATAEEGIGSGISADNLRAAGLEEDIPFCARESVLTHVPRVVERSERAVVIA